MARFLWLYFIGRHLQLFRNEYKLCETHKNYEYKQN